MKLLTNYLNSKSKYLSLKSLWFMQFLVVQEALHFLAEDMGTSAL